MNQQYSQQYSQPNGTFEKVDNMLVNCGSFASIIQIVISVICIICLCTSAYFLYNKKDTRIITDATVLHGDCKTTYVPTKNGTETKINCILDIEYIVNEKVFNQKLLTTDKMHYKDEKIKISYDINDPNNIVYNEIKMKTISYVLFGIGSLCVISLIIHVILMNVSDWYKRIMCLNMVGNAITGGPSFGSGSNGFVGMPFQGESINFG